MSLDIILLIIAILCLVVGLVGTVVPVLPGAPLAWIGLLIGRWISFIHTPIWLLILTGIIAIVVSILDNIFPVTMTKKFGGSKAGTWGCTIGLIVGFFIGPWGIIFCPFVGAFIGELIHDHSSMKKVFKAAFGAFLGFLCGIGTKMSAVLIFIWIFIMLAIF